MPITEGFTSRRRCSGPPTHSFLEKKKKPTLVFLTEPYATALKWNEADHPRVTGGGEHAGEFTSGKGTAGKSRSHIGHVTAHLRAGTKKKRRVSSTQRQMQQQLAEQAKKPIHHVKTPEEGVALILKGENVELQDTKAVHTILKKLGEMAMQAKAEGKDAPNFDPCTITVKGTSLFCSEKIKTKEFPHGVPRIEMPQFKTKNPVPGSPADKLPRDASGEVDATSIFMRDLDNAGVAAEDGTALAKHLKASQAEMEGAKVAGMMVSDRDPKTATIIVSNDDYVVDGHHTWAAAVGRDAEDGNLDNDMAMNVVRINLPMSQIYHLTVAWTKRMGLPQAGVKKRDYRRALLYKRRS